MNFDLDIEDINLDELGFDLDVDVDLELKNDSKKKKSRLVRVKRHNPPKMVKYEYAKNLVNDIGLLDEGDAVYALVSGNFIAGDIFEAYLNKYDLYAEEIIISTLSYSQENIDSLRNIQLKNRVDNMSLLVSDFFFSHERRNGIKYAIDELTQDNQKFTMAVAGLHTKVALIKTTCGKHLVFHGSANLRSNRCIEQFIVECSKELYYFNREWIVDLINRYTVTHKSLRGDKLWQQVIQEAEQPLKVKNEAQKDG